VPSFFDYPTPARKDSGRAPVADVLLPDAPEADWTTMLEFTQARRFGAGQTILAADGPGGSLYLVLEGTIEVVAPPGRFGRSRQAGHLEAGAMVGEVSFFDGEPRSMGVRAVTAAALAEMTHGDVENLFAAHPDLGRRLLMDLGRILAGRLRRAEPGGRAAKPPGAPGGRPPGPAPGTRQ
jgi:CRP-like cAMP-binding protein